MPGKCHPNLDFPWKLLYQTHVKYVVLISLVPPEEPSRVGPQDSATEALPHLVLPGHRSIVNQVRYSRTHHLLCSSGVEKVVKVCISTVVLHL